MGMETEMTLVVTLEESEGRRLKRPARVEVRDLGQVFGVKTKYEVSLDGRTIGWLLHDREDGEFVLAGLAMKLVEEVRQKYPVDG